MQTSLRAAPQSCGEGPQPTDAVRAHGSCILSELAVWEVTGLSSAADSLDAAVGERKRIMGDIRNCAGGFRFRCPGSWEALEATDRPDIRFCPECREEVYYCKTDAEMVEHAE